SRPSDERQHRALHGLTRSLIANMVHGVTEGFSKVLEIQGVGYRATARGKDIELAVGYSHPVPVAAPEGISLSVESATRVVVSGRTLVAASSLDPEASKEGPKGDAAKAVGLLLGKRATESGISSVVFDRGGYRYHGRVRQVAEGAREAGLKL